jgi:hypothetical protein
MKCIVVLFFYVHLPLEVTLHTREDKQIITFSFSSMVRNEKRAKEEENEIGQTNHDF